MNFLKEFFEFCFSRKKYFLIPIFITLILLSILFILSKGSAVAPFIYTIF